MTSSPRDHDLFPTATIARGERPTALPVQPAPELATLSPAVLQALDDTSALGSLVLRRGTVIHESCFRGHGPQSPSNAFSMAKPVVTLLLGVAIADGKIRSLEQAGLRLPAGVRARPGREAAHRGPAGHAHRMEWDDPEVYDKLFAWTTRLYLGRDVQGFVRSQPIVAEPGTRHHYNSANTALAAMVLEKATGRRLGDYLSE